MVPLSLNDMREGDSGIVVENNCGSVRASRLAELGLTEGESVQLVRRGSPMVVRIGETRLCLRADESSDVTVLCAE